MGGSGSQHGTPTRSAQAEVSSKWEVLSGASEYIDRLVMTETFLKNQRGQLLQYLRRRLSTTLEWSGAE